MRSPARAGFAGEDSLGYSESEQLQFSGYPGAKNGLKESGGKNITFGGMQGINERDESE